MNTVHRRRYDMLDRIRAFCVNHRDIFEGTPLGATMLEALDRSVTKVTEGFALQSSGRAATREGTTARRNARAALRRRLESIRRTSRFLGLETAGEDRFPRPRRASDRELLADARAVAQHGMPLTDAFVSHGLPPGVLRDLPAQIQALEQAILSQRAGKEMHLGGMAGVGAALRSGVAAFEALESIVLNAQHLAPETLAIWKSARRVGPSHLKEAVARPAQAAQPATPTSATRELGLAPRAA